MQASKVEQAGFSLMEIIMATAVIGIIIIMSMRQYLSFRMTADSLQIKSNVDQLFTAMGNYYHNNCYGTGSWGTLNPNYVPNPLTTPYFPIDIPTDLYANGYTSLRLIRNPVLANDIAPGTLGYVAQFNLYLSSRYACTQAIDPTQPITGNATSQNCKTTTVLGTVVAWKAQLAVHVLHANAAQQMLALLGGDCLSQAQGKIVLPCSANQSGDYVVWERNPTTGSLYANSNLTYSMPAVNAFTQSYRTYNTQYLSASQGMGPNSTQQYFVCGN